MMQAPESEMRKKIDELIQEESTRLSWKIFAAETKTLTMDTKVNTSQWKLCDILEEWEEKFQGLAKDVDEKSAGMTGSMEKRFESETTELDTKLTSLEWIRDARDRVERTLTQENEFCRTETAFLAMKIEEVKIQLGELRFDPMTATALNSSPKFKHSEGVSSQERSTSGTREFKIPFNAEVTGVSPREISSQSASDVGRKYEGMGPDD